MEAIAFSQLQETMRTGIQALTNMCILDRKMSKATNLQKKVSIRQAKRAIYKKILALDNSLENLTAHLQVPTTSIELLVSNNLKKSQKKHIKAIREARMLNEHEQQAREEEIIHLANEINRLQDMLNQLRAESSSDDDSN